MSYTEILNQAIDYAINSKYQIYDRQDYLWEKVKQAKNICIFGLGKYYRDIVRKGLLSGLSEIKYVCDNNSENYGKEFTTNIQNAKCISVDELKELEDVVVLITVGDCRAIKKQLDELDIESFDFGDLFLRVYDRKYDSDWFIKNRDKILKAIELFEDNKSKEVYTNIICNRIAPHLANKSFNDMKEENEYFSTGIFELTDEECIVDCGAYIGDSLEDYYRIKNGKFATYYCFELDYSNCMICQDKINEYHKDNIVLINAGVSNENTKVAVTKSNGLNARVDENGSQENTTRLVRLDDELSGKKVTFIKMDIEGAEIAALDGAKNIISEQKPKLAISAYHYLSDLWEVPLYINSINPQYKLFLRHHTADVFDTDCYAFINK